MDNSINQRVTPKGDIEGHFRRDVRYALDLDIFARDEAIVAEIQRLKRIEARVKAMDEAIGNVVP